MHAVRSATVLGVMMLAAAVAAPSVVAYEETGRSGPRGEYIVPDSAETPGVTCRFENHPGKKRDELDKISTRRMTSRSAFSGAAYVGQRIIVQKNAKPFKDGKWKTAWKSGIIKRLAPGDSGDDPAVFPARHWKAPENSRARFRVKVVFVFYQKQSKTKVAGSARGIIEVYRGKQRKKLLGIRGAEGGPAGACQPLAKGHPGN